MNNGILASNNTRDVIILVKKFNIEWIKTGDILYEAVNRNIINSNDAEKYWKEMIVVGRHLGKYKSFNEYVQDNYL